MKQYLNFFCLVFTLTAFNFSSNAQMYTDSTIVISSENVSVVDTSMCGFITVEKTIVQTIVYQYNCVYAPYQLTHSAHSQQVALPSTDSIFYEIRMLTLSKARDHLVAFSFIKKPNQTYVIYYYAENNTTRLTKERALQVLPTIQTKYPDAFLTPIN